jgi:hypothetical protein
VTRLVTVTWIGQIWRRGLLLCSSWLPCVLPSAPMPAKRKAEAASAADSDKKAKTHEKDSKKDEKSGSASSSASAASSSAAAASTSQRSVWWDSAKNALMCVDQRNLPHTFAIAELKTVAEVESAIKTMLVRGAPAIGAAGGFGMAIAGFASKAKTSEALISGMPLLCARFLSLTLSSSLMTRALLQPFRSDGRSAAVGRLPPDGREPVMGHGASAAAGSSVARPPQIGGRHPTRSAGGGAAAR